MVSQLISWQRELFISPKLFTTVLGTCCSFMPLRTSLSSVLSHFGVCQLLFCKLENSIFSKLTPFFSNASLSKSFVGVKIGQVVTTIYYTTLYVQLFKAINRFLAIASPMIYRKWYAKENTQFIIAAVMLLSFINGSLYFFPGCNFYFDAEYFTWTYDDTPCYDMMSFYTDLIMGCSIVGTTMLIDITTLYWIFKSKLFTERNNRDVRFFAQAFSTSIVYTIMLVTSQGLYKLSDDKWYVFGTVTLSWEMCHAIDG